MSKSSLLSLVVFSSLALTATVSASANTVTFSSGMFSTQSGAVNTDFDSGIPSNYSFSGVSGLANTSVSGQHLAPTGDSSYYAWVAGNGSITAYFGSGISYLGIYVGSPDGYNSFTFTDSTGTQTTYVPGVGQLTGKTQVTSQYVNFYDTGAPWTSVTFLSSLNALEFDNVATIALSGASAPEPSTVAIFAVGLLGVALIRKRFERRA